MVADKNGYTCYVPSSWQVHNKYFPRSTKNWICTDTVERYKHLVEGFYSHPKLHCFYASYMQSVSLHYKKIFIGYAVKYAIRLLVIYLDKPQQFNCNPKLVMMRYFTSLNAQLWTKIYQCNRHNMDLLLPKKSEMVVPLKYLLNQAEKFVDVLIDEANFVLKKYQQLHSV